MKSEKASDRVWWLFIIPLLIPVCIWAINSVRQPVTIRGSLGVVSSNAQGGRLALRTMVYHLSHKNFDKLVIDWIVKTPGRSASLYSRAGCSYDRQRKLLLVYFVGRSKNPGRDFDTRSVYSSVTQDVLNDTIASNGTISDLVNHGAHLDDK